MSKGVELMQGRNQTSPIWLLQPPLMSNASIAAAAVVVVVVAAAD